MKTVIAFLLLALGGCSTVLDKMPTARDCYQVIYVRQGTDVTIHMQCVMPDALTPPVVTTPLQIPPVTEETLPNSGIPLEDWPSVGGRHA